MEKIYEINFDGHVKCIVVVKDNELIVKKAMNGYGNAINVKDIITTDVTDEK